jgi:hypothetical protein
MISIQIHGSAIDTTDDRYRAEDAALTVFAAAGCTPRQAEAEYHRQFDRLDCEVGMTGLAKVWIKARDAAQAAASEGWSNPSACKISMHA